MTKQNKMPTIQRSMDDEIDLFQLLQILIRRKVIILTLTLTATIIGISLSILTPKVYRGEFIIKLPKKEIYQNSEIEMLKNNPNFHIIFNPNDIIILFSSLKLDKILSQDYKTIKDIRLEFAKNSNDKLNLIIESTEVENLSYIGREVVEYMNQNTFIKDEIEKERQKLQIRSEELNKILKSYEDVSNTFKKQLKEGKLTAIGFNPIEFENDLLLLKIEKSIIENTIKNLKGLEILSEIIPVKPLKPKPALIIIISIFMGLIVGIFLALFLEYYQTYLQKRKE